MAETLKSAAAALADTNPTMASRMRGWLAGDTKDLVSYIAGREASGDTGTADQAKAWLAELKPGSPKAAPEPVPAPEKDTDE